MGRAGRLNSGLCLVCGVPLIFGADDYPIEGPYQLCSEHTKMLMQGKYNLRKKIEQGKYKFNQGKIIPKQHIVSPTATMGPEVPGGDVKFAPKV